MSAAAVQESVYGKILPIEMKKKNIAPTLPLNKAEKPRTKSHKLVAPSNTCFKNENLSEIKSGILETSSSSSSDDQKQNSNNSKSFWNFKRSRSLNCGTSSSSSSTSYARTLCPLPLLSRSNSTPSVKHKQHSQKSSSSISTGQYQKPPLRKIPSNTYNNGIKINSVLNVPPPSFFGLSSIFSTGKEKYKKR
ncbi:PREDICTED: cell wall integrity and stress response component 1-like [Nicotiana attenuata]|uniref:Uncharacterized protein n=1 Tax=Nicotiana attenuata TaxID=49451 RepID=A0A314LAE5_NICAT|nr:PREDICTED: cell wall integrity and stress response component 1-like [Nicotiana attenuata]OIT38039.1 hypothetical protein A4A49_17271 [Nicotiana attenuata]